MRPAGSCSIRNGWLALLPLWLVGCRTNVPETSTVLIIIGLLLLMLGALVVVWMKQRADWHKATQRKMRRAKEKSRREAELQRRELEQKARQEVERRARDAERRAQRRVEEIESKSKQEIEEKVREAHETARQSVVKAVQDTRETAQREVEEKVREAEVRIRQELLSSSFRDEPTRQMAPPEFSEEEEKVEEEEEEDLKATMDFQPRPEQVEAIMEAERRADERELLTQEAEQEAMMETLRQGDAPTEKQAPNELFERMVREETGRKAEESEFRQTHKAAVQKVKAQFQQRMDERRRMESAPIEAKPTTVWPPHQDAAPSAPMPVEGAPLPHPGASEGRAAASSRSARRARGPAREDRSAVPAPVETTPAPAAEPAPAVMEPAPAPVPEVSPPVQSAPGELPAVILAEDSNTMRKIFTMVLSGEPYTLITVPSGREALEKARQVRPALMIADLSMDDDGYYVCREMKADPELAHIPVLLLHSQLNPVDEDRAGAVGADGDIEKPFDSLVLVERIKEHL